MTKYWQTKTGERIKISELLDSHIRNILKYFNGFPLEENEANMLRAVIAEARKRGIDEKCIVDEIDPSGWYENRDSL